LWYLSRQAAAPPRSTELRLESAIDTSSHIFHLAWPSFIESRTQPSSYFISCFGSNPGVEQVAHLSSAFLSLVETQCAESRGYEELARNRASRFRLLILLLVSSPNSGSRAASSAQSFRNSITNIAPTTSL
jgi:hypothetical protein